MGIGAALLRWLLAGGRERTVGPARGRVLELGVGSGETLPHYRQARTVVALDPSHEALLGCRGGPPAPLGGGVGFVRARAEALPLAAGSLDTVTGALVFCSIGDPMRALAEVRRVLGPGGELRLVEHVRPARGPWRPLTAHLAPLWRRIFRECRLDRDTLAALGAAGFRLRQVRARQGGVIVEVVAEVV